jgi:hypothetical protein
MEMYIIIIFAYALGPTYSGGMAAVLDAMAPYVMQLIAGMAEEEVSMLLGVSGEITKLEDNMEGIRAFLTDAERRCLTDKSVQRWVRKLKGAMYDATDILDLCQLEAEKRREAKSGGMEEKPPGCCRSLLFFLRNPVFAHRIGSRIKELNQRLDAICKDADRFKFIDLSSYPERRVSSSQKMSSEIVESAIVGEKIEQETRELAHLLITGGNHDIKVVSIVGRGRHGKDHSCPRGGRRKGRQRGWSFRRRRLRRKSALEGPLIMFCGTMWRWSPCSHMGMDGGTVCATRTHGRTNNYTWLYVLPDLVFSVVL